MLQKRRLLRELTILHGLEEQAERLRPDAVRSDELMVRIDPYAVGDEVQQRAGIDDEAGHARTIRGCTLSPQALHVPIA